LQNKSHPTVGGLLFEVSLRRHYPDQVPGSAMS
jgi:hypothetical protein